MSESDPAPGPAEAVPAPAEAAPAQAAPPAPPAVPEPSPAQPPAHAPIHSPGGGSQVRAVLTVAGFLLLIAGLVWVWSLQNDLATQVAALAQQPPPELDAGKLASIDSRLKDLDGRLTALQKHPAPSAAAPVSLAPLEARIAALEGRGDGAAAADTAALKSQLAAFETRLKALEQEQAAIAERALRVLGYERAQLALEAGTPLGDLPGAPPALAKFAKTRPPTESALRLAFPAAAQAAEAASRPTNSGQALLDTMWTKIRSLVTVRQGDKVLLGPPSAAVLGDAHAKLEAGDLAGAVATLDRLDTAAAAAMADWRGSAQALLDARAALAAAAAN